MYVVEIHGVDRDRYMHHDIGSVVRDGLKSRGIDFAQTAVEWKDDPDPNQQFFRNQRQEMVEWLNHAVARANSSDEDAPDLFTNEGKHNLHAGKACKALRDEWSRRFSGRVLPLAYYAEVYRQVANGWGLNQDAPTDT